MLKVITNLNPDLRSTRYVAGQLIYCKNPSQQI